MCTRIIYISLKHDIYAHKLQNLELEKTKPSKRKLNHLPSRL